MQELHTKIYEILHRMEKYLDSSQLLQLKSCLCNVFEGCELIQTSSRNIIPLDSTWKLDLNEFLTSKSLEGKSEGTLERYEYELTRLLSSLNKTISNITSHDISNYLRLYKQNNHVKNSTLRSVRSCYSTFFSWCRDCDKIYANPMRQVEKIKTKKLLQPAFSDSEREKLFRCANSLRDKALLEFLYSTGMRVSECANVDIDDINWNSKDLVILGKGNKERKVYLSDTCIMYLKEYLNSRCDDNSALFVTLRKPYNRMSICSIESVFTKLGQLSGIIKCNPHRMRHTTITNALNRGMPIQEASLIAGHASTETTMLYWTADEDSVRYHHKKYLSA